MYSFFAYLDRMKYINRWSLMRSNDQENIMEHSAQVCMIAHALAVIGNVYFGKNYNADKVVSIALFHETSEVITGDLPTPIKYYNPQIRDAYKAIEEVANDKLIGMLPDEMQPVYASLIKADKDLPESKLVKYADKLSAYVKCLGELKGSNNEFKKAKKTIEHDIKNIDSKEVEFFMEHFIKPYSLTLDELD
ncbi:MAG: 5'-deoxynucleotidase [Clostridia bacterium]|nr:5'-deoxynucleotidase [Clostridia bacterium]